MKQVKWIWIPVAAIAGILAGIVAGAWLNHGKLKQVLTDTVVADNLTKLATPISYGGKTAYYIRTDASTTNGSNANTLVYYDVNKQVLPNFNPPV